MKNKILCPTPVTSLFFYFPFHSSDPSSFVSFYSQVKQGSLYFDCNPNGTQELAERENWRKERETGDKMTGVGQWKAREK